MTQASRSPAVDGAPSAAPQEPASGADAQPRQRLLPRRGLERLDLLLLCLEALDLNGGEAMVWLSELNVGSYRSRMSLSKKVTIWLKPCSFNLAWSSAGI